MFNIQRTGTAWGAHLKKAAVAALLVAGAGAATAVPVTVSLCAAAGNTGATGLPANTVVYGYGSTCGAPTIPGGPTIVVNVGDVVTVTLTNNLTVPTGLMFQGQALPFDGTGAAAGGGTKSYTFTASQPGTYLYEAAPIPGTEYQVAMGLYGALVVRPSVATQAYDSTASAFDNEAVLVLSELDPALNSSAAPASFDMRKYAPKYFLINGKPYPKTDPLPSTGTYAAGSKLALRYLNAGAKIHSMGVLGLRQVFVAKDGNLLPQANHNVVAESIAPGQTADAIVTFPATLTGEAKFAVYDAGLGLYNNGSWNSFGGMLAFAKAGTGTAATGPTVTAMSYTASTGALLATITAGSRASTITGAEYWFDTNAPTALATTGSINTTISAPTTTGAHTLNLRGLDGQTPPGAVRSVSFAVDTAGPAITGLTLTPNANGTVSISATANDSATGGSNVTAAQYRVDGGAWIAANLGGAVSPIRTLGATTAVLATGSRTIDVQAQDSLGNWTTPPASAQVTIVGQAPSVSGVVTITPSPNNGSVPLSATQQVVRVSVAINGNGGAVAGAEGFVDTNTGAQGSGFVFVASDGAWGGATEAAYADIPLTTVSGWTTGTHTIYVRGKNSLGQWGGFASGTIVIDKTPPTTTGVTLTPTSTNSASVSVSATISDTPTGTGVTAAEYFIDNTATAAGSGTPMTLTTNGATATISSGTVAALTAGTHTVYVRGKDAAGNWSTAASATLNVDRTPPTFNAISLSPNSIQVGTASVTLTVNGASDGNNGSGVVGGEYWFGATNVALGAGTPFNGTTATINTASLLVGTTTVRVRIRDAAGNWSTGNNGVRTANLTVTPQLLAAPGVGVSFSPASLSRGANATGRTSMLTITLSNSTGTAITGAAFSDALPQGGSNGSLTAITNPVTTCGGTATRPNANNRTVSLTNGTIPANGSCTVTVSVQITATAPTGTRTNTVNVTSSNASTGTGSGNLAITN